MFNLGAFCFGLVIGWITYRTVRRTKTTGLSDIASVIGAVGGAAVVSLFPQETDAFNAYCIGLAIGFFAYLIVAGLIEYLGGSKIGRWLGTRDEGF
jgi:hypothetical protein